MPSYQHPGVYLEEILSGARPIESVGTSTAAIIGFATKGPIGKPVLIFNWSDYIEQFGGIQDRHGKVPAVDYMGHSVRAFFQNGGGKAYIVRVAQANSAVSANAILVLPIGPTVTSIAAIADYLNIAALSEGSWANGTVFELVEESPPGSKIFTANVKTLNGKSELEVIESYPNVSLDSASTNFVVNLVNGKSSVIQIVPEKIGTDLSDSEKKKYLIGTLTSLDLSGITTAELNTLAHSTPVPATNKLKIKLDVDATSSPEIVVNFLAADVVDLNAVAAKIQTTVRNPTVEARKNFTCVNTNGILTLTSGTNIEKSSVKIITTGNVTTVVAPFLTALTGGSSQTGIQAFKAKFNSKASNTLSGGADGSVSQNAGDFTQVFQDLRKYRDVSIIMLPDCQNDSAGMLVVQDAKDHAEYVGTCMVVVDPPKSIELKTANSVGSLNLPSSPYTALYYPWVEVANPHYHSELRSHLAATYLVPPSGFCCWNLGQYRRQARCLEGPSRPRCYGQRGFFEPRLSLVMTSRINSILKALIVSEKSSVLLLSGALGLWRRGPIRKNATSRFSAQP